MFLTKLKLGTAAVLCACLIGGSFTSLGIAQDAKPKPLNGEIVGRLIDAATGKPVEGATIACGAIINDSGKGGGANAVTDAQGRYRLLVPSPGIYNVWLKKFDKDPSKTAAADDGILVEAGKIAPSQLHLVVGRKLAGKVVNSDGKPLANLGVSCYSPARPQSGGAQSVNSKADGTFEFSLPPGRAYVYANDNPFGVRRFAYAVVQVSAMKDVAPMTLTLQESESKFGDPEWFKRSTPGTQIVRREGNQDVTGTVVDGQGKLIAGAKVFRYNGPLVPTNDKGEFRVETMRGTQFVMHAFAPGYHVWVGTPTSGDVLKIVLEPKQPPLVGPEKLPKSGKLAQPASPAQVALAWDLTPPTKEPKYQNEPRYALLVFGPKREQRVWMVLDGTTLYVDRNGNGDLTEPGERLEPNNPKDGSNRFGGSGSYTHFDVFEFTVQAGATGRSKFRLDHWVRAESFTPKTDFDKTWHAKWLNLRWENSTLWRKEGLGQAQTPVLFMPKPADAQVCALDGPLTFMLRVPAHQVLRRGEAGSDLAFQIAVLGRPPRGAEQQFCNPLATTEVPAGAHLEVEIEYPAKAANAAPLRRKYLLKERC